MCMLEPSHGGVAPPSTGNPGSAPVIVFEEFTEFNDLTERAM